VEIHVCVPIFLRFFHVVSVQMLYIKSGTIGSKTLRVTRIDFELVPTGIIIYNGHRLLLICKRGMKMIPLRLPYGTSDFYKIRTNHFLYVDKTRYIEKLESLGSEYLFFIRPRRFGKSLFLSMLENYYDLHRKNDFERLFGDLYIGKHSTERRNQYFILRLNFSGLNTSNKVKLELSFLQTFKRSVIGFFNTYAQYFEDMSVLKDQVGLCDDTRCVWDLLFGAVKQSDYKIYLIIDEYDHFANNIIAMGEGTFYKEITHAAGFVRSFYEAVKIGTESVIDRLFITGVSPIMLDDLTSGFNISDNLTMEPMVGEMMGFTEEEVREIVAKLQPNNIDPAMLMDGLRSNYNGYLFHKDGTSKVYNPTMILYFFNRWSRLGHFPEQLIDENMKADYTRLRRLILNERNRQKTEEIILHERASTTAIVSRFSFDRLYDERYFVSLLFYMGLLTMSGTPSGKTELVIPNYVVKTVFWEYFGYMLEETTGIIGEAAYDELKEAVQKMASDGKIDRFVAFLRERILKLLSRRDMVQFHEKHLKCILLCCLSFTNIYQVVSEREVEQGFADILLERNLLLPQMKYEWLLELKVVKEHDRPQLPRIRQEAMAQLQKYAESREIAGKQPFKAAALFFIGKEEIMVEELGDCTT
jgi:hypothetical protein